MRKLSYRHPLRWALLASTLLMFFNNCGDFASKDQGEFFGQVPFQNRIQSKVEEQHISLQSGEQLARSMASVLDVPYTNTIVNEYNSRKTLLAENHSLESVTSPMLISITNMASQFCNEAINQESQKPQSERNLFSSVDFTRGLSSFNEVLYFQMMDQLAMKAWGRALTQEERSLFTTTRNEFLSTVSANQMNSGTQTKNFVLFNCSSMLSSFDFVTI